MNKLSYKGDITLFGVILSWNLLFLFSVELQSVREMPPFQAILVYLRQVNNQRLIILDKLIIQDKKVP